QGSLGCRSGRDEVRRRRRRAGRRVHLVQRQPARDDRGDRHRAARRMNGLLVIDKQAGMTSHDVVAMCRRILGERRVGHAGTLDPSATGVLVLGVGRATRLLRFVEDSDKEYVVTAAFGITTSTLDAEGEVVAENDTSSLTEEDVRSALTAFVGDIEQVPPMVSAVKVGGEPLYRKARRGEDVERAPRRVRVHELDLDSFEPGPRARATLRVRRARRPYVRSPVAHVGAAPA